MPEKEQQQSSSRQNGKPIVDDLLGMLSPDNMLSNAQKVISSAVNVLEEEIAAGILAAKQIERKIIDVDSLRNDPENLMNRIRKDSHEALDIFLDTFTALSRQIGLLTETVSATNGKAAAAASASSKPANNLQILEQDEPATAGQEVRYHFALQDETIEAPINLDLQKSDFIGPGQYRIPARHIELTPSSLLLNPKEEKEVNIVVRLPKTCKPGHYNSLFTVAQMPAVKIVLSLEVK